MVGLQEKKIKNRFFHIAPFLVGVPLKFLATKNLLLKCLKKAPNNVPWLIVSVPCAIKRFDPWYFMFIPEIPHNVVYYIENTLKVRSYY
jgi:hypothetical protein